MRLERATFNQVRLDDVEVRGVDVTGARVRGSAFTRVRMRGVELIDVEINGELERVVVNGVDIAPLVDAELNRRMPDRAKMRPSDSDAFREAWSILVRLWDETVARARTFPEEALHRQRGRGVVLHPDAATPQLRQRRLGAPDDPRQRSHRGTRWTCHGRRHRGGTASRGTVTHDLRSTRSSRSVPNGRRRCSGCSRP